MIKKIYRTRRITRATPKNMNWNSRDALSRLKMASISTPIYTTTEEASQTASMNSEASQEALLRLYQFPQASRRFYELLEGSKRFLKILEHSK
jgi:hypothetical protein